MTLDSTLITLDGAFVNNHPLVMTARRYTSPASQHRTDGLTLLFTHCVGGHKELWEPIIDQLFQAFESNGLSHPIREAVSFDYQSHGDAALLNKTVTDSMVDDCISSYVWANALAAYIRSPALRGRRLVAIGHSAGASALTLAAAKFPLTEPPFLALILVEPVMSSKALYAVRRPTIEAHRKFVMQGALARRDTWASRSEARTQLARKMPWKLWDARVLDIFVEHALHTITEPGVPPALTPKLTKRVEALSYPDVAPHLDATELLSVLSAQLPVHVVWGTRDDFVSSAERESVMDETAGRVMASITVVQGAGHLIVQERPDEVARALCTCLNSIGVPVRPKL